MKPDVLITSRKIGCFLVQPYFSYVKMPERSRYNDLLWSWHQITQKFCKQSTYAVET